MRVLSLHQPWAWFVIHGFKPWETRAWSAQCHGPLLIHASQKFDGAGCELYYRVRRLGRLDIAAKNLPAFEDFHRGCIVGKVNFDLCMNFRPKLTELEEMLGDFSEGRWFLRMNHPEAFSKPIPAKGHQRFWNFDLPSSIPS